jgi:DNA-binding winged helix-turn-helix (wHTH) protein
LVDGVPVHLGGRAFDLLVALADRAGRVTHKDELLQTVWPGKVVEENRLQGAAGTIRRLPIKRCLEQ